MDDIGPILMMAIVAVLLCTVVVGVTLRRLSSYGLVVCLLLGAIVATTRPRRRGGHLSRSGRAQAADHAGGRRKPVQRRGLHRPVFGAGGRAGRRRRGHGRPRPSAAWSDFHRTAFVGGGLAGYAMGRLACLLFAGLRGFPTAEITPGR